MCNTIHGKQIGHTTARIHDDDDVEKKIMPKRNYSYCTKTNSFDKLKRFKQEIQKRTGVLCSNVDVQRFGWLDDYGNVVLGIFLDDIFNFMTSFP